MAGSVPGLQEGSGGGGAMTSEEQALLMEYLVTRTETPILPKSSFS